MGRDLQEVGCNEREMLLNLNFIISPTSLVQSLPDHVVLLQVQPHDGLLEVSHSAVDQLGAATAGAAGEVVQLHQGRLQAAAARIDSAAGSSGAAANNENIKLL